MRRIQTITFLSGLLMLVFSFGMVLTQQAAAGTTGPLFRTPVYATATALALTAQAATAQAGQPPAQTDSGVRVYDNFRDLVIFRYPSGDLAFYHLATVGGGFHSWMLYGTWANAAPGKTVFDRADEWGYRIALTRLTEFQANTAQLWARPDPTGMWFQVTLTAPEGKPVLSDYLFLIPR